MARATACADTAPASHNYEPASTNLPNLGNSHDRNWGIPVIVDTDAFETYFARWATLDGSAPENRFSGFVR
jgi:hypothetical protein